MYTIELKLERKIPLDKKRAKVKTVIDQLNLRGCQGVRIGNSENRGISGLNKRSRQFTSHGRKKDSRVCMHPVMLSSCNVDS